MKGWGRHCREKRRGGEEETLGILWEGTGGGTMGEADKKHVLVWERKAGRHSGRRETRSMLWEGEAGGTISDRIILIHSLAPSCSPKHRPPFTPTRRFAEWHSTTPAAAH